MKLDIDRLLEQALDFQSQALADVSDIEMRRLEMTMLNNFKQIQTYLTSVNGKKPAPFSLPA